MSLVHYTVLYFFRFRNQDRGDRGDGGGRDRGEGDRDRAGRDNGDRDHVRGGRDQRDSDRNRGQNISYR